MTAQRHTFKSKWAERATKLWPLALLVLLPIFMVAFIYFILEELWKDWKMRRARGA